MKLSVNIEEVVNTDSSMIKLLGGYAAPIWLYTLVCEVITPAICYMTPNTPYKCKELCGEEFWDALPSNYWKYLAGRCFAHMVSCQMFPVKFVQYKKYPTKHYQTK